jgi:ATP-dependent exoDNAse (exonuclease V) beta subunit
MRRANPRRLPKRRALLYVAATRARDKLIVCGLLKISGSSGEEVPPSGKSFLGMIREAEKGDDGWIRCCLLRIKLPHLLLMVFGDADETARMLLPKTVSPAKLARLSASAYAMWSWCPAAYRIAYRQGRAMQWTARSGEGSGGSEFGSLAHWVLSKWDFSPGRSTSGCRKRRSRRKGL